MLRLSTDDIVALGMTHVPSTDSRSVNEGEASGL